MNTDTTSYLSSLLTEGITLFDSGEYDTALDRFTRLIAFYDRVHPRYRLYASLCNYYLDCRDAAWHHLEPIITDEYALTELTCDECMMAQWHYYALAAEMGYPAEWTMEGIFPSYFSRQEIQLVLDNMYIERPQDVARELYEGIIGHDLGHIIRNGRFDYARYDLDIEDIDECTSPTTATSSLLEIMMELAGLYYVKNYYRLFIQLSNVIMASYDNVPPIYAALGEVYFKQFDFEKSIEYYTKFIHCNFADRNMHYALPDDLQQCVKYIKANIRHIKKIVNRMATA